MNLAGIPRASDARRKPANGFFRVLASIVADQVRRGFKSFAVRLARASVARHLITDALPLLLPRAPASTVRTAASNPFQKIELCRWKADRWNDGDSFHVITGDAGREIVARLYFVDTPEAETAYKYRLDEQSGYWRITREQGKDIAHEAAAFTAAALSKQFTVWTRWNSARGRSELGRVYCIIITAEGRDLNELLVENGLARIYGVRTPLPDGRTWRSIANGSRSWRGRRKRLSVGRGGS